jgi:hypothetical protein
MGTNRISNDLHYTTLTEKVFLHIVFLFAFDVAFFNTFAVYRLINMIIQLATLSVMIIMFISHKWKVADIKKLVAYGNYYIIYLISTVVNTADILNYFRNMGNGVLLYLILFYCWGTINRKVFMVCFSNVSSVLIIGNLLSVLIFPEGLYRVFGDSQPYFLLGHKNIVAALPFVLSLFSFTYYRQYRYMKKYGYLIIGFSVLTTIVVWSANSLIAIIIALLIIIMPYKIKMQTKIYTSILITTFAVSIILTTVSSLLTNTPIVRYFLTILLKRDTSLSARTFIWSRIFKYIAEENAYLFGIGYYTGETTNLLVLIKQAHNSWLNYLFRGGIIFTFTSFVTMLAISLKLNKIAAAAANNILGGLFVFFCVWFIADAQEITLLAFMLPILFYIISSNAEFSDEKSSMYLLTRGGYHY